MLEGLDYLVGTLYLSIFLWVVKGGDSIKNLMLFPSIHNISLDKPYRTKISKRKLITISYVSLGNFVASTHLILYYVATSIYDFLLDDGFIGLMKSNTQYSKGLMTSCGCRGISSDWPGRPILWQLSHA